jgi:hypothetical protein
MVLALFVGAANGGLDQSLRFSWSLYNVTVILAYAVALGSAYFSARSYGELPSVGITKTVLSIASIVVAATIATILWSNGDWIRRTQLRLTLNRIDHVLFQDYVYKRLSPGERRLLHGDVATALEKL